MVRSITLPLILLACVAIAAAMPTQALASSVYSDEIIPEPALAFFRSVLNGLDLNSKYVAYCSGAGTYTLAVGDLVLSEDGRFTGAVDLYSYSGAGYQVSSETLDLDPDGHLVYSNLGSYPVILERGNLYEFSMLFLLCVVAAALLIRSIFSFSYRNRYGT